MAKLHFFYSVMNAGKSSDLIRAAYIYEQRGDKVLFLTHAADDRFGVGKITTRMNHELAREAVAVNSINAKNLMNKYPDTRVIMLDEAQFFDFDSIYQLSEIVDNYNIPVMAYGLKVDSNGNLFPGAAALLQLAQDIKEIKTLCNEPGCSSKATHILRYNGAGQPIVNGPQICIGDEQYKQVCRKHWKQEYFGPRAIDMKRGGHQR